MPADYAPGQRLAWEYLAHSEIGLVRKNNQDSGLVSSQLLMVADGMGGAAAGDLASAVAVDTMAGVDLSDQGVGYQDQGVERLRRLAAAISAANTRIADLVSTDYTLEGMGTTVTAAVLD
ncbi:MAG: protein phosphatase 2C domain-containing protein, partial [Microlunatus sp.]|nr:protein phosphatase 2C domain-containing protein [Microlunatus sp.]